MLQRVQSAADRAASKWRQSRGIDAGLRGLELGLLALAVSALLLELRPQGLQLEHGLPLLGWFLLGPALAGLAWARRPELEAAASRLDREAGLSDRLGTALEFAQDRSAMAELQRADAAEHAEQVDLDGLFPVPWRERLPRLAVAACLALLVTGAGLTFRLGPAPEIEPTEQAESAAEDLLATIDRERRVLLEEGNKEAVAVLTDLERTIRSIQVRQEELRRIVRQRQVDEPPDRELDLDLPEPSPLPTPAETGSEDLITAEDLERLEAETLEQLELTDAMEGQIVAELFSKTRKSKDLMAQFDGIMRNEMEHAHSAQDSSEFSLDQPDPFADTATGVDEVAESFSELVLGSDHHVCPGWSDTTVVPREIESLKPYTLQNT